MAEVLIGQIRLELEQARRELAQFRLQFEQFSRQNEQSFRQATAGVGSFTTALRAVGPVLATIGLGQIGSQALSAARQFASLNRAFTTITGSAEQAGEELSFLRREADRLGLDFISAAQSFQGLAAAARGTALEGQAAREVFTAVAQASATLGLSADQTSGALTALQQIMSKGTVQAEELRGQLGERIPGAFQIAARAMGVTTAELGKMLEQGQVLSDDFLPRFARQLSLELPGSVDRTTQATARLSNAWQEFIGTIGRFARENEEVQQALNVLAGLLNRVTESITPPERIDTLIDRLKEIQSIIDREEARTGIVLRFLVSKPDLDALRKELGQINQEINETFQAGEEVELFGGTTDDNLVKQEQNFLKVREELRKKHLERVTILEAEHAKIRAQNALKELDDERRARERAAEKEIEDARNAERTLAELREKRQQEELEDAEEFAQQEIQARQRVEEIKINLAKEASDARIAEEKRAAEEFNRIQERTQREQQRIAEQRAREVERFTERVEDRLADVFQRALEGNLDLLDTLKNAFFATIAQMAARAASQAIVLNILPSLGLGPAAGGVPGAGGLGLFSGGAVGNFLNTPISSIFGGRGAGIDTTGAAGAGLDFGPAGAEAVAGAPTPAAAGPTIGTVLGGAALGVGVGFTSNQLLGQLGLGGQAGRGLSGALGGAAGGAIIGGPIGAGIGALLGGVFSAFGIGGKGKKPQFLLEDFQLSISETLEDIVAEATGNKRKISFETEQQIEEAIEGAVQELLGGVLDQARTLAPDLQAQLLMPLNDLAQEFADAIEGAEFDGKDLQEQFQQFMSQELPATFAEIFGEITQEIRQASVAATLQDEIQAQIDALQDAIKTPAQLFTDRLDQLTALQGQLTGAGETETIELAGQISQLVGSLFQLSGNQAVLGQDPRRLRQTQDELIQALKDLQQTVGSNLIPSFQGLQHPLTFTQPTFIQAHQGETLLPAGSGQTFNITVNAGAGQNPQDIAAAVIREAERRARFR